jgi:hypothetical protein
MRCPICSEDLGAAADGEGPPVSLSVECPQCGALMAIRSGPGMPLSIPVRR